VCVVFSETGNEEKPHPTSITTWALKASAATQVKLQPTIPMVVLRFLQEDDLAMRVEKLNQANVDEITGLSFNCYDFNEDTIVHAISDLFHRAFLKVCVLSLTIEGCTGRIDEILRVASSLDMFGMISLEGDYDPSLHGFWSISSAMKYNKCLTKLELQSMELTRQQAAALGAGLVTVNSQNRFKELRIESVTFSDGAITELASGLKQNSSLCILSVAECTLEDTELAKLVDAVKSHPSLKELSLWDNAGQKHTLAALGKVLASSNCQLEELDFSCQGIDDDGGLTGWLGLLQQGLQWNESLTRLDLSNNGLRDEDIDDLGQILASCKLETLNFE
jgi:hypothetical protein